MGGFFVCRNDGIFGLVNGEHPNTMTSKRASLPSLLPQEAGVFLVGFADRETGIRPGDYVVVDYAVRPTPADLVLATWHGGSTVRRLRECPRGMEMRGVVSCVLRDFRPKAPGE